MLYGKKAWLGTILVFLLGALAGGLITHHFDERRMHEFLAGGPRAMASLIQKKLTRDLDLTQDQQEKVGFILREEGEQVREQRRALRPAMDEARHKAGERIREILTPEQRAKFDSLQAKHRERPRPPELD